MRSEEQGRSFALQCLEGNRPLHIDMIESIRRGTGAVVWAQADGVLVRDDAAKTVFLTAMNPETADRLIARIDGDLPLAAVHQDYAALGMERAFGLRRNMICHHALWTGAAPPVAPQSDLEIRALNNTSLARVAAIYAHGDADYIRGRIAAGEMIGAFEGETLAGFMGLHIEGSMGMLEVLPEYRRQGVASLLIRAMCARLMALGRVPFSQFTVENEASRRLHERLGFEISPETVYWLER